MARHTFGAIAWLLGGWLAWLASEGVARAGNDLDVATIGTESAASAGSPDASDRAPSQPRASRSSGTTSRGAGPCVARESASYRVTYGIFGQVAEAELSLVPAGVVGGGSSVESPLVVQAQGVGRGEVLGFGKTDKRLNSEFDARGLAARRWHSVKSAKGKTITDDAEQPQPGAVALVRRREGESDLAESFRRSSPVLDPLSFLLRLRISPPTASTTYEVLDGRALWLAEVSAAKRDETSPKLLRMDGKLEPIYWGGGRDEKRSSYSFTLFLTRDRHHTPVRLVVPFGFGEVRAELVQLSRSGNFEDALAGGGFDCREPLDRPFWRGLSEGWPRLWRASLRRRSAVQ